jgi:hypothetical protein
MDSVEERLAQILEARTRRNVADAFAPILSRLNAMSQRVDDRIAALHRRVSAVANDEEDALANEED